MSRRPPSPGIRPPASVQRGRRQLPVPRQSSQDPQQNEHKIKLEKLRSKRLSQSLDCVVEPPSFENAPDLGGDEKLYNEMESLFEEFKNHEKAKLAISEELEQRIQAKINESNVKRFSSEPKTKTQTRQRSSSVQRSRAQRPKTAVSREKDEKPKTVRQRPRSATGSRIDEMKSKSVDFTDNLIHQVHQMNDESLVSENDDIIPSPKTPDLELTDAELLLLATASTNLVYPEFSDKPKKTSTAVVVPVQLWDVGRNDTEEDLALEKELQKVKQDPPVRKSSIPMGTFRAASPAFKKSPSPVPTLQTQTQRPKLPPNPENVQRSIVSEEVLRDALTEEDLEVEMEMQRAKDPPTRRSSIPMGTFRAASPAPKRQNNTKTQNNTPDVSPKKLETVDTHDNSGAIPKQTSVHKRPMSPQVRKTSRPESPARPQSTRPSSAKLSSSGANLSNTQSGINSRRASPSPGQQKLIQNSSHVSAKNQVTKVINRQSNVVNKNPTPEKQTNVPRERPETPKSVTFDDERPGLLEAKNSDDSVKVTDRYKSPTASVEPYFVQQNLSNAANDDSEFGFEVVSSTGAWGPAAENEKNRNQRGPEQKSGVGNPAVARRKPPTGLSLSKSLDSSRPSGATKTNSNRIRESIERRRSGDATKKTPSPVNSVNRAIRSPSPTPSRSIKTESNTSQSTISSEEENARRNSRVRAPSPSSNNSQQPNHGFRAQSPSPSRGSRPNSQQTPKPTDVKQNFQSPSPQQKTKTPMTGNAQKIPNTDRSSSKVNSVAIISKLKAKRANQNEVAPSDNSSKPIQCSVKPIPRQAGDTSPKTSASEQQSASALLAQQSVARKDPPKSAVLSQSQSESPRKARPKSATYSDRAPLSRETTSASVSSTNQSSNRPPSPRMSRPQSPSPRRSLPQKPADGSNIIGRKPEKPVVNVQVQRPNSTPPVRVSVQQEKQPIPQLKPAIGNPIYAWDEDGDDEIESAFSNQVVDETVLANPRKDKIGGRTRIPTPTNFSRYKPERQSEPEENEVSAISRNSENYEPEPTTPRSRATPDLKLLSQPLVTGRSKFIRGGPSPVPGGRAMTAIHFQEK